MRLLAVLVVVAIFIAMTDPVKSQTSTTNGNVTLKRYFCSLYQGTNENYFLSNLNSTLSSLRRKLSTPGVHYAVARTLLNGESVWGLDLCREYLSTRACLACYDSAVQQLRVCKLGNGGHAFYDDCDVRMLFSEVDQIDYTAEEGDLLDGEENGGGDQSLDDYDMLERRSLICAWIASVN